MLPPEDFFDLADAKAYLGIASSDTSNDALLQLIIPSVTQAIVDYLQWDPNYAEVTERYHGTGTPMLAVNRRAVSDVAMVTICQGPSRMPIDLTHLYWDDRIVYSRACPFPRGMKNVEITYTAGYMTMPASIVMAAKMTLKAMWSGKDFEQNATGSQIAGVESIQFWPTGPGAIPPQTKSLIDRYVLQLLVS